MATRHVFVISDLHIGGEAGLPTDPKKIDFRIFRHSEALAGFIGGLAARTGSPEQTELIINGDFVDFLAERDRSAGGEWTPLKLRQDQAVTLLQNIAARERVVFDALKSLLAAGADLTVILGNHDIELTYPKVRKKLAELLGTEEDGQYKFLCDGKPYYVADAVIEHGNDCDDWNRVDFQSLEQALNELDANPDKPLKGFKPPAGSKLVADVMNPIKEDYSFVDLLKPETDAVPPLLLALEPGIRNELDDALKYYLSAKTDGLLFLAVPDGRRGPAPDPEQVLAHAFDRLKAKSPEAFEEFKASMAASMTPAAPEGVAEFRLRGLGEELAGLKAKEGLIELLLADDDAPLEKRLPALKRALQVLEYDKSFDRSDETGEE